MDLDHGQQSATVDIVGCLELKGRSAQAQGRICIFREGHEHGGVANLSARTRCISPEKGSGSCWEVESVGDDGSLWNAGHCWCLRAVVIIFTLIEYVAAILAL